MSDGGSFDRPTTVSIGSLNNQEQRESSRSTVAIACKQFSLRREFANRELLALYGAEYGWSISGMI
jgi:hypothetical protein